MISKVLIAVLLLYHGRLMLAEEENYLSIEELLQRNIIRLEATGSNGIDPKDMGLLKMLDFSGKKSLYIGAKNRIYKANITEKGRIYIDKTMDLTKAFQYHPFPMTFRNVSNLIYENRFKEFITSYDTCLSYYERSNLRNGKEKKSSDPYIRTMDDVGKYPSNSRPNQNWIRFGSELESHICRNTFVRGLEKVEVNGTEYLWACGTFASFPKAFLLNPITLEVINSRYSDTNVMSCARWPDESMATKFADGKLYVGSGWGLYRPDTESPDVPYNNSTMLYSDWKMLWNGHYWPTRMAMVFGRDVRFIPYVHETKYYLYFFGHEVNPQYSYINAMTRQAYRSFMVRICKNDTGFNYTATEEMPDIYKRRQLEKLYGYWTSKIWYPLTNDETAFSYSSESWGDIHHFPTKHFTSAMKFPFGCYLKRFDGAQSMNFFWGEQNMIYFNRLADVQLSLNWTNDIEHIPENDEAQDYYDMYHSDEFSNYDYPTAYSYNGMVGAFSSSGFASTRFHGGWEGGKGRVRPSGAVCQFQVGEWKTDHLLHLRDPPISKILLFKGHPDQNKADLRWEKNLAKNQRQYYFKDDSVKRRYGGKLPVTKLLRRQEFFALYGTLQNSFYTRGTNWFQGMQPTGYWGVDFMSMPVLPKDVLDYLNAAVDCGRCRSPEELEKLKKSEFEKLMNHSSLAWPTDWLPYMTKSYDAFFHLNPMAVAGDNASFVLEGVDFMKMIVLERNFTNYYGANRTNPLLYVVLISTEGDVYRVVMCDLVSYPIKWTTCEMRNTDQPYVTLLPSGMWYNHLASSNPTKPKQARVSSLLSKWRLATADDYKEESLRLDPQSPLIKDAYFEKKEKRLYVATGSRLMSFDFTMDTICGSYSTCIDCASDPYCGWEKGGLYVGAGTCRPYNGNAKLIQDVMGRGEMCHSPRNLKYSIEGCNVVMKCDANVSVMLKCNASSMYRGRIHWKVLSGNATYVCGAEDEEKCDDKFAIGPQNSLVVIGGGSSQEGRGIYECVGVPYDGGEEEVLAKQVLIYAEDKKNLPTTLTVESYCPCVKVLAEKFPNNGKLEKIYNRTCTS